MTSPGISQFAVRDGFPGEGEKPWIASKSCVTSNGTLATGAKSGNTGAVAAAAAAVVVVVVTGDESVVTAGGVAPRELSPPPAASPVGVASMVTALGDPLVITMACDDHACDAGATAKVTTPTATALVSLILLATPTRTSV